MSDNKTNLCFTIIKILTIPYHRRPLFLKVSHKDSIQHYYFEKISTIIIRSKELINSNWLSLIVFLMAPINL